MPSFYSFGNKWSVKNNKATVRNSLTSDVNTVNIDQAVWDGSNNVTSVGTNGRPSYYGCYDMNGNVFEWNDTNNIPSARRGIRGGFWGCCNRGPYGLGSDDFWDYIAAERYGTFGLRIASLTNSDNLPNFVLVGDAGNSNDTVRNRWNNNRYGAVAYEYYINKFKVTNDEYTLFLNSVASTDTYLLYFTTQFESQQIRGIIRTGSPGSYVYSVKNNYGNKPFTNINWFTCARYCNWLHNGKPTGAQNSSTTEDGAYLLNGATTGNAIAKKAGAKYFLPTENEWYKAAYYKGGGTNRGYWRYATQSNDYPRAILADVNGNGTLRPTSFRPSNTVGSGVTTETITDNIFNVGLSLNYEQVASSGVTQIVPITSGVPSLPPNFSLSNNIGQYNISTTSSVSGNIDIKFILPVGISLSTFNNTKIFHTNSSGTFDVTVTSGPNAPNYSTRTKYGRVTGFSDFHLIPSTETALNQVVPSSLVGSAGNGYVDLSWSMSNAIDIIDYNIKYSKDNGVSWIDYKHIPQIELSIRVSGLTNGTSYLFKVASVSAEGLSELSASSSPLTPLSIVPSAPSNVVAVSALNSANLTWDVPSDNGGSAITNYDVQYSSDNGSSWSSSNDPLYLFADDVSTTRSLIVTNLSAIPYIFRVSAINSVGSGSYSSFSNSVTPSGAAEVTPTPTPSSSSVAVTPTPTNTITLTATPTATPTATLTSTPTITPTNTITSTPTTTPTNTPSSSTVSYTANAVILTSGSSYTVPAGANSMKVWVVGAGGSVRTNGLYAGAGGVAYRTYSVTSGSTIGYTVNQTISGTSDTGGSNTTVTYDGITIRGYGGEPARGITWQLLGDSSIGLGGTFGGAADGGAAGGNGRNYGGYENGGSSGAVGRGGDGLNEWLGTQAGTPNSCKRITAADISGLFEALALANVNTTESCGSTAAFGSSAFDAKFGPYKAAGIGGGGIMTPGYGDVKPNGSGAVVIKFMGTTVSNPKPSYAPTAVLLTSGAVNGALANISGGFQGSLSNFQQYTVPSGATVVKAWAVGGGGYPNAGGVAYAEWMVYSGQIIYYRIGSYGQPSYVIGGHRELPTNEAAHAKKLLIGNGGRTIMNVNGAGSYGYYSGGDGGANGSATTNNGDNDWGGAVGGATNRTINQRNQPNDVSGLLAAVTLSGGSTNFGAGGFDSEDTSLSPGIGGGARYGNGSQGCVVFYFT